jgi:predicted O-methyltransferase YrrM
MLKYAILNLLPGPVRTAVARRIEISALAALPSRACRTEALRANVPQISKWPEWPEAARHADRLGDAGGAVNLGDRQAIYSLTRALNPRSVLEIGTHLGGSTVMFALALRHAGRGGRLTTVDIVDVNGPKGAWVGCGTRAPKQLIADAGCDDSTTFVTSTSVAFMTNCNQKFDLIFLDGNHEAQVVYQEVPLALELLADGGVILMHDVYPNLKPLWSDGAVIPGPVLAIERFRREGTSIGLRPLGSLPWPTKLGSTVTSLALLVRT